MSMNRTLSLIVPQLTWVLMSSIPIIVNPSYNSQPKLANESCVGLEDWNPCVALVDGSFLVRPNLDLGNLQEYLTNSKFVITRDDTIYIHNIEPVIDLPLSNPHLIDWSQHYQEPHLLTFQNDNEITCYLNSIEPIVSYTSEPATSMTELDIKYLSQKIKRKENKNNRSSDAKNHCVVVSEPKKLKINGVSKGENLLEVPTDEVLDCIPNYF